jgi:hypothetical protein
MLQEKENHTCARPQKRMDTMPESPKDSASRKEEYDISTNRDDSSDSNFYARQYSMVSTFTIVDVNAIAR